MRDALRANLLTYHGYQTQVLEFIDFDSSPKNLLIRAEKKPISTAAKNKALQEVEEALAAFNVSPTLYNLLLGNKHN